jgi:hypothetical protein
MISWVGCSIQYTLNIMLIPTPVQAPKILLQILESYSSPHDLRYPHLPACTALGETLWTPESTTASIQLNLDYFTFSGNSLDQQYWIAPSAVVARTIDGKGQIVEATNSSTHLHLPALCTQSAPFSDISTDDNLRGGKSQSTLTTSILRGKVYCHSPLLPSADVLQDIETD